MSLGTKFLYLSFPREYLMSQISICLNRRRLNLTVLSAMTVRKDINHCYLKVWCRSICVNLSQEKCHCNQWSNCTIVQIEGHGCPKHIVFHILSFFIHFPGFISFSLFPKMKHTSKRYNWKQPYHREPPSNQCVFYYALSWNSLPGLELRTREIGVLLH